MVEDITKTLVGMVSVERSRMLLKMRIWSVINGSLSDRKLGSVQGRRVRLEIPRGSHSLGNGAVDSEVSVPRIEVPHHDAAFSPTAELE